MSAAVANGVQTNGNGVDHPMNGDVPNGHAVKEPKFASGLILPPPEIKSVIDRTANFVAKTNNPTQFEDKIRETQHTAWRKSRVGR